MSYIGNEPIVSATRTITEITATAGQTVFVANGGYTVGYIDVFVNGAQLQTADFTALDGSSITLAQAAQVGDDVRLVAWGTFQSANAVPLVGNSNITGNVNVSGKVGVGTATPATSLHIVSDSITNDPLRLESTLSGHQRSWTVGPNVGGNGYFTLRDTTAGANRFIIDTVGRVTTPYQPAFATTGTNYTQASSGYSIVIPSSETFDIGNNFNISTGRFTAPVAGRYFFNVSGLVYPVTAGQFAGAFHVNGSLYEDIQDGYNPGQHNTYSISNVFNLAANDVVDFRLSTGSSSVTAYGSQWMMSGYLIG